MAEDKKIHLSKKDVLKAFWKWTFFSHSNYNYERLQASGVLQSMSHLPEKLYPGDKEEQQKFMERHMSFYNTPLTLEESSMEWLWQWKKNVPMVQMLQMTLLIV